MVPIKFSIIITTKNRLSDLQLTLSKISSLISREDVECIICDDGSTDGTSEYLARDYPNVKSFRHPSSMGLIYSRNKLVGQARGEYVISIDDDLHFLTSDPLDHIERHFSSNPRCAVISFRIFWSLQPPDSQHTDELPERVISFAGGANAWRMSAWKTVREYPAWFVFYGEENFAAYELFRGGWEIHYLPEILVHHRVELKLRKKDNDFVLRQRRSLRADWYLYMLFVPLAKIPRLLAYSVWIQLKTKVFKGNLTALWVLFLAGADVFAAVPKFISQRQALTLQQFYDFRKLPAAKIYWKPKEGK